MVHHTAIPTCPTQAYIGSCDDCLSHQYQARNGPLLHNTRLVQGFTRTYVWNCGLGLCSFYTYDDCQQWKCLERPDEVRIKSCMDDINLADSVLEAKAKSLKDIKIHGSRAPETSCSSCRQSELLRTQSQTHHTSP